ncbi:unnamed protein product [Ilex paraguariensis]|uniref:Uncharacterized protein n=1 Tax=Ilex paraguariensis TaxID=185542 RepID=A0ABC8RNQ9_9AQUA
MASSKKTARIISRIASRVYFLLIIFQIPLFRIGTCTSPIEVTSSQLIASKVLPAVVVKSLLYPGAIANAIVKEKAIPGYDNLLNAYKFHHAKEGPATTDLQHLEILAGSYLCVAGAFLGIIKPSRVGLFGICLLMWGLTKELSLLKHAASDPTKAIYFYPTFSIAVVLAFLSVRGDVRKIIRGCKPKRIAHPFWIYAKAKNK